MSCDDKIKIKRLKKDAIPTLHLDLMERENCYSSNENREAKRSKTVYCSICRKRKNTSIHGLPVDDERRRIWFQNLGIDEKYPEDRISALKICGEHFSPSDFTINPWSKKKTLKENATPIKVWSSDVRLNSKPPASLIGENSNIGTEIEMTDPDPSETRCSAVQSSTNHSQSYLDEIDNVNMEMADPDLNPLNCLTVLLSENHSQETTTENNNVEKNNYIEEIEIVDPVLSDSHSSTVSSEENNFQLRTEKWCSCFKARTCDVACQTEKVIIVDDKVDSFLTNANSVIDSSGFISSDFVDSTGNPTIDSPSISTPKSRLSKDLCLTDHLYVARQKEKLNSLRYVGDVRTPHLSSPISAKKCWNIALQRIATQKKKISELQQKLRTSSKRVKTMQHKIDDLKERKLISDATMDELLITFVSDLD